MTSVLFIAGSGRNGSTLLERVVGQVPGVAGSGELRWFWNRGVLRGDRCGCGEPFAACEVWQRVVKELGPQRCEPAAAEEASAVRRGVERTRNVPSLLRRRRAPEGFARYAAQEAGVVRAVAAAHGVEVVIDSSSDPVRPLALARGGELDVAIVHLVRDSRAVAASWKRVRARKGQNAARDTMPTYSPGVSALKWIRAAVLVGAARRAGIPVLRLRYEHLVVDPAGSVRNALQLLGVEVTEADLAFVDGRTVDIAAVHTVSGNPSRFDTGRLLLEEDRRWMADLGRVDRLLVTGLTLPWLARYGYLRHRRSP